MELPMLVGYIVFIGVPLLLWLTGVAAVKRRPMIARFCAFMAGSDNRLSLSRIQAFAWTLVIFGSFAAAMAVHTHIVAGTDEEISSKKAMLKTKLDAADADLQILDRRLVDTRKLFDDGLTAESAAVSALSVAQAALLVSPNDSQRIKTAEEAQAKEKQAGVDRIAAESAYKNISSKHEEAEKTKGFAKEAFESMTSDWVSIPSGLLSLAGIAIASGVFSSLISAVDSEAKTACVTGVNALTLENLRLQYPSANAPLSAQPILIEGENLGSVGRVRIGNRTAPNLFWSTDGKTVVVDASRADHPSMLVLETSNGKIAYQLSGAIGQLSLGLPEFVYDLADLFRDDKNPTIFSLMKFQMFGWTVVAIVVYIWIFLHMLSPHLAALPKVDSSIVLLTGLSQGGYLVGKAVSGISKPDDH